MLGSLDWCQMAQLSIRPRGRPSTAEDGRVDFAPGQQGREDVWWEGGPDKWSARHVLVCRMHAAGLKNVDIAEALNVSEQIVSITLNDPRAATFIKQAVEAMAQNIVDLNTQLKAYSREALEEIVEQMRNSHSDRVRQVAAFGILDRAGYTPVQRHTVQAAPELPKELAERVAETHIELREIITKTRYGPDNGKSKVEVEVTSD